MSDNSEIVDWIRKRAEYFRQTKNTNFARKLSFTADTLDAQAAEIERLTGERDLARAAGLDDAVNRGALAGLNEIYEDQLVAIRGLIELAELCEWAVDDCGDDAYLPGCKRTLWCRYRDTPAEDQYEFCPSCGKPIKFKETT